MEKESYANVVKSADEEANLFSPAPSPSSSSYSAAAQMICFGAMEEETPFIPLHEGTVPPQMSSRSSSISSLSSSPSSISATNIAFTSKTAMVVLSKLQKKVENESTRNGGRKAINGSATSSVVKKLKTEASSGHGSTKARKEKIGDRIVALQQLVSPFGKSDTASVLQEALGYIRFLHDQVQVLSSPYLQHLPSSASLREGSIRSGDLRSRGLCLIPVSYMEHVASTNGADLWSPAAMGSNGLQLSSTASKQQK